MVQYKVVILYLANYHSCCS